MLLSVRLPKNAKNTSPALQNDSVVEASSISAALGKKTHPQRQLKGTNSALAGLASQRSAFCPLLGRQKAQYFDAKRGRTPLDHIQGWVP